MIKFVCGSAKTKWCPGAESNHRHHDFQSCALPTELPGRRTDPNGPLSKARGVIKTRIHTVQNAPRRVEAYRLRPREARNRCFSATPSRIGSTRGGSSAAI